MYRAVLDACVLVPSLQRDFLLQLATVEAFSPLWGSGILTELDYTLAKLQEAKGIADSAERRRHLLAQMKRAFPGSEVSAPKDRAYDYGLKDLDDGHVAHAALIGKADAIVTDDKRGPTMPLASSRVQQGRGSGRTREGRHLPRGAQTDTGPGLGAAADSSRGRIGGRSLRTPRPAN